jgi:hypothetical protein
MAKRLFPTPETYAALAGLLGLDSLDSVRTIKINIVAGEATTVDFEMFIWDEHRLTSVVEQLTADTDRVTNVKIEVTPKLLEQADKINVQSVTDPEPVYIPGQRIPGQPNP